jgi:hypothetical protein
VLTKPPRWLIPCRCRHLDTVRAEQTGQAAKPAEAGIEGHIGLGEISGYRFETDVGYVQRFPDAEVGQALRTA